MYETICGVILGSFLLAWLYAEFRCSTRIRIILGLFCVGSPVISWAVAEVGTIGREAIRTTTEVERLGWIEFYAEHGDLQKVRRLVAEAKDPASGTREVKMWQEEDAIANQIRQLGGYATPCPGLDPQAAVYVVFSANEITETTLQRLGQLPRIGLLWLDECCIADDGLREVGQLTDLQSLSLSDTNVTDAGLEHLHGLHKLRDLDLTGTNVTDEGVRQLRQRIPSCQIDR